MPGERRLRRALVTVGVIAGTAVWAAPAEANHHVIQVREVFPGPGNTGYVELQMYAAGQGLVEGHDITLYGPTGLLTHTFSFPSHVANDTTGRETILVGDSAAAGNPDFTDNGLELSAAGGGACFISNDFGPIDCVAWGDFAGTLPSAGGSPASPAGVTAGKALRRTIARGCASKLDGPDDTDESAADFSEQTPTPRNNSVAPVETECPLPPNTTLAASPRPGNPTNQSGATFEFSGTGSFTGFECKLDTEAAFSSCTSPKTYAAGTLAAGSRTFQVRAVGAGGPDPTPASYTWTVDLTAPDTTIGNPRPVDPNAGASSSLSFSSSEPTGATFRCRLITPSSPSPSFAACSPPSSQATPASGAYTFEVTAKDQAGNEDPTPATYSWMVDRTPPDTEITATPANPSDSASADFDYISTEPTGATFRCRLDGAASFTTCPVDGVYTGLNDGSHTFRVRAVDPLGNEDPTEAAYSWTVDASSDPPPDTTITKAPKKKGTDKTPKVSFTATPPTSATFQCRVDDGPFEPCASPHTTAKLKTGKHTFEVVASGPGGADPTPAKASFKIIKR